MIYLDNSATTRPYEEVIDAYVKVATHYFGNPSSVHALGSEAERLLYQSREVISKLLSIHPSEIIFTSGGTEGNNIAIKGTALKYKNRGKHIITTAVEHASIQEGLKQLEKHGFEVTFLPVNKAGAVAVQQVKDAIRPDTILVTMIHVNNEVGTIQPIQEIGELLKQYPKILFHVDDVQGMGKVPLSIVDSGIDLLTISGHKFHSVKGTGMLYVRQGVKLEPLFTGGSQENQLRAGTENVPGIVAMTKALRMTLENQQEKMEHLTKLRNHLTGFLNRFPEFVINTPLEGASPHIVNFSIPGLKPEVVVHALEDYKIYVSTKSACSSKQTSASRILLEMGMPNSVAKYAIRVSLSTQSTLEEIQAFCSAIETIIKQNKVIKR
ncbi:cysteine desulfurase [Bacillus mesophilus]|uniref:Cysteine desulfurase n=1 Tax=Bacillus mesophilus TaxID=1808955 RepID=A0A6M0Q6G2_9BACI|nr:cysteine desulfurase family protein [Bacillus mesophilus]MBM7660525.1 cysteine desulfurase [Bacillus mesophilus]NEY71926.1 cysteine desulfurase [Bacillus mesophilus]